MNMCPCCKLPTGAALLAALPVVSEAAGLAPARPVRAAGATSAPLAIEPSSVAAGLAERARRAEQGPWVPACGGSETVTTYRTGRRLLYCWQASTGRHAYLDADTDRILDEAEARAAIGMG